MVLKELIFKSFYVGGCGGLERTDFQQFLLQVGVVVLKELILIVDTSAAFSGLERADF